MFSTKMMPARFFLDLVKPKPWNLRGMGTHYPCEEQRKGEDVLFGLLTDKMLWIAIRFASSFNTYINISSL